MQRVYWPEDVEGFVIKVNAKHVVGLITWAANGERAEMVSIDALEPNQGIGRQLLTATERHLATRGVTLFSVATSNNNLSALGFYQKLGFRLRRIYLDGMDRVREHKPHIPRVGLSGLPLMDMWKLEKSISR